MKKLLITTVVAAMTLTVASAGAASAAPGVMPSQQTIKATPGITVLAQGETSSGHWVAYSGYGTVTTTMNPGGVSPQGSQEVGGGTWEYGSYWLFGKHCYSKYYHRTDWHGSTVEIGGNSAADWKGPGKWSNADAVGEGTCYAFYRK